MALAIYIMHGRGSSKEMRLQLQPDKAKVMLCIIRQQKVLCTLFITNKMDHFSQDRLKKISRLCIYTEENQDRAKGWQMKLE